MRPSAAAAPGSPAPPPRCRAGRTAPAGSREARAQAATASRDANGTPGSPGPPVRNTSTPRGALAASDIATRSDSRPAAGPNGSSRTLSDPQLNACIPGHGRTSRSPARSRAPRPGRPRPGRPRPGRPRPGRPRPGRPRPGQPRPGRPRPGRPGARAGAAGHQGQQGRRRDQCAACTVADTQNAEHRIAHVSSLGTRHLVRVTARTRTGPSAAAQVRLVAAHAVALTSKVPSGSSRRQCSRRTAWRSAASDVRYAPAGPTPNVNGSHHDSKPACRTRTVSVVTWASASPAWAKSSAR